MSVNSPVPPPVRPAGTRRGASRLGYWIGGGLVAAACIGAVVWVVFAFLGLMNQVNGFQRMTVPVLAHRRQASAMTAGPACAGHGTAGAIGRGRP